LDDALASGRTVIYLSFGTAVTISAENLETVIKGISLVKNVLVIWPFNKHKIIFNQSLIPENFKVFTEQIPQLDVLAHPAVKVFVSHCGANSLIESLYFGKPILGIPVRGDQFGNAAIAETLGAGESLKGISNLDEKHVFEMLTKVMTTPKYREAAENVSRLLHMSNGAENGAREIEFFAHVKNYADYFTPLSYEVPWFVKAHLDIILFILVVLFLSWKLLQCCTSYCCRCCHGPASMLTMKQPKQKEQ